MTSQKLLLRVSTVLSPGIVSFGEDFGLLWQGEAATQLSDCDPDFQSGVALCVSPQSKLVWLRL